MKQKTTQIRITNISNNEVEVNFNDLIESKDLTSKGIQYAFNSTTSITQAKHIRISSTDVFKSIIKITSHTIKIKDYEQRFTNKIINIPVKIDIKDFKIIIDKMNHIVITFFH